MRTSAGSRVRRGLAVPAAAASAALVTALAAPPALAAGPEAALNDMSAALGLGGQDGDAAVPESFYTDPSDPASVAAGDVLRSRGTAVELAGVDAPVDATTVLYRSTDTHGAPNAVSGTVLEPQQEWQGPGERPLVVVAPGTQGQGDQCAPSRKIPVGGSIDNLAQAAAFLAQGYSVAVTDYEGLGTPGMHTYANRAAQGNAVLDMARATSRPGSAGADGAGADGTGHTERPVALWGYSQGGEAVAAAAELIDDYAPELDVRGGFAGAPPADLGVTVTRVDGSRLAGAIGYAINGILAEYPEIADRIDTRLNDRGRQMLRDVAEQCTSDSEEAYGGVHSTELTATGQPIDELLDDPFISTVLDEQRIGGERPGIPMFVVTGDSDDIVPSATVRTMVDEWRGLGGDVTFRDYPIPPLDTMVDHVAAMPVAAPEALGWINDRLAG